MIVMEKQRVIVYVDGFNFYYGLRSEARQQVFVYFPPNHYSTDLNSICNSTVFLNRYENRFKQCLLPDVVHLEEADYDLHIPEKWKQFQLT